MKRGIKKSTLRNGKFRIAITDRVKYLKSNSVLKTMELLNIYELGSTLAYTYEN